MATQTATVERAPTLWASVREAILGSQQDYTEGSLARAILLLSVPMVVEMAGESLFGLVDVFFVARLGPTRWPRWPSPNRC